MEEVDKIIIDSLRNINCDLPDEISSLKEFEPDNVLCAFSTCLEIIKSSKQLPKKLPLSLSARINVASNVAQDIREIGFKGDMGYQTILYCNETEVRRILMFLIERLPKESSQAISIDQTGYIAKIVKQIEESIRISLNRGRVLSPSNFSIPFSSIDLVLPNENTTTEESKLIPLVTEQCDNNTQLIPSILFERSNYLTNSDEWRKNIPQLTKIYTDADTDMKSEKCLPSSTTMAPTEINPTIDSRETKCDIEQIKRHFEENKVLFSSLQSDVKESEAKLNKIKEQNVVSQQKLNDTLAQVKIKNKTLAILSSDENKEKLKASIVKLEKRLKELAEQWHEIEEPLLEECNRLKSSAASVKSKHKELYDRHHDLKTTYQNILENYKEKCIMELNLMEKCKELNKKHNRSAYTKRILEIVGNIKKQNCEIDKVLSDTKLVQKDINNLTGQIDRSFTLSDELIFSDCKKDESARKSYKLLAALREECNRILDAVTDLGQIEREQRNLEEQIDIEKDKDMKVKLDKVLNDLHEIKKEIKLMNG